jgi:L-iditol 2-dehydrogenase
MKVAVYYNNHDIRIQEHPIPEIKDGEILVKVQASGICGTDVMEWYRIKKAPRILGHEISGEIAESKSPGFKPGQRVFVSHHVPCNKCKYCLEGNHTACETLHTGNYEPGGYSEYIRVPKTNAELGTYILPDTMTYEEATMIEPLACAVRAQRIIGVKKDQIVFIPGCGVSGLLNIRLAKLRGAKVIASDINDYRLNMAKLYGADETYYPDKVPDIKADRIVICTGALPAFKQAFGLADRKAVILLFAIPDTNIEIPTADFWRNELTVTSSYGAAPADLKEAMDLIESGKVNVKEMITHTLGLEQIQEGFRIVEEADQSLKVVLIP